MSGPISSDRKVLRGRLEHRQFWAEVFGWIVGVGLVVEYWKEITDCIITRHWPSTELIGGILVTAGVFGEVFFSRLAGITTDTLQELADSDVAQSNRRAAEALESAGKAERAAAEANGRTAELNAETERLRKENNDTALLLRYRSIGDPSTFEQTMRGFSGTKYTLEFLVNSNEAGTFQNELNLALTRSDWIGASVPVARPYLGFGIYILTVPGRDCIAQSKAAEALADWLDTRSIATFSALATPEAALASPDAPLKPTNLDPGSIVIRVGPKPETIEQQERIRSEYQRRKHSRSVTPQA